VERASSLVNSKKHARLWFAPQDTQRSIHCFSLEPGHLAGGFFEEFVDKSLVGLGLFGSAAAELAEEFWGDAKIGSSE
jgi:hypothetical protein